jgi:serine/threonine protein phosphatase 1
MRTLALGDIHGCLHALNRLLEMVRPEPDDVLIMLGDYVDRGPDSRGVIDRLLDLCEHHRLVCLRGNHDQMMLEAFIDPVALRDWLQFGGRQTLASYARNGSPGSLDDVPESHWEFFESTVPYYETTTHFFVHANVRCNIPLDEQSRAMLYWQKLAAADSAPHTSGKIMVCGHTSQKSGVPLDLGHAVCIDTFVYGTGWLTCLDVATGEYWQARQSGKTRTGRLGEPVAE